MTTETPNNISLSPFIKPDGLMMSGVLDRIGSLDVSDVKRRDFRSAVLTLCRLIERRPEEVPANINWIHVRLRRIHPVQAGMSEKRLKNIRADLLKVLELCGASRARSDWLREPSDAWKTLLASVPSQHDVWKLMQLAQYCSALGIGPESVESIHVRGLLKAIEEETFVDKPDAKVNAMVAVWNRLGETLAGWPTTRISYPRRREPWTFKIEMFPQSFQDDVARLIKRISEPDPLNDEGPAQPLRPASVKAFRFQIQEVASALVRSGVAIKEVVDLAFVIDFERLRAAIRFLMGRFEGKATEAIHAKAIAMKAIAKYHVKVSADELRKLEALCNRLGKRDVEPRTKNRIRLEQLDDDLALWRLLSLPAKLVAHVGKKSMRAHRQALVIQAALAVDILLHAPIRMGNLSTISIERHVRRVRVKGKDCLQLSIPGHEVKNGKDLNFEFTDETLKLYDLYVHHYRPRLLRAPSEFLFPAQDGGAKHVGAFSDLIKKTILEHTGLVIHPHLFRSIAGKIHMMVNPGDFATVSHAIGDTLKTTMKSYAQFERKNAIRHYQASVETARLELGRTRT